MKKCMLVAASIIAFEACADDWYEHASPKEKADYLRSVGAYTHDPMDSKRSLDARRAKQAEAAKENGSYKANMLLWSRMDATNPPPTVEGLSAYLKDLGRFHVMCETNSRAGTIDYRVVGSTNLDAAFVALKQMPNRTRIGQGTNWVAFSIKLPSAQ